MIRASSYFFNYILRIYLASKEIELITFWCWLLSGKLGKILEVTVVLF